jgi:hypothetical protein
MHFFSFGQRVFGGEVEVNDQAAMQGALRIAVEAVR